MVDMVDLNSQDLNLNLISLDKFEQLPQKQCENETRQPLKKKKRKIQEKKSKSTSLDEIASSLAAADSASASPTSTPVSTSVPLPNNNNVITKNLPSPSPPPSQPPKEQSQLNIPKSQPPPLYPSIITHPLSVPKFQPPVYYPPQMNLLYSQNPLFYPPKETQPRQIIFVKEKPQPLPIIDPTNRKQIVIEKPQTPISAPKQPSLYQILDKYTPSSLASTERWFDHLNSLSSSPRTYENNNCIAIDCEMVGVGVKGKRSALARVSIVNYYGEVILNKYVRPTREITDYRTKFSGITPELLVNASDFKKVQKEVKRIMRGHIVVGQSVHFDFKALKTGHPDHLVRDTSFYNVIFGLENEKGTTPSLKKLAKNILGIDIQEGEHDSIEDARASMILYRYRQAEWEQYLKTNGFPKSKGCKICGSSSHVFRDCDKKKNFKNEKNGKSDTNMDNSNVNNIKNENDTNGNNTNDNDTNGNDNDTNGNDTNSNNTIGKYTIDYDEYNRDPNTSKYYSYSNPSNNINNYNSYFTCSPYVSMAYPYNYRDVNRVSFG